MGLHVNLKSSSFLGLLFGLVRISNKQPKKELHWKVQVSPFLPKALDKEHPDELRTRLQYWRPRLMLKLVHIIGQSSDKIFQNEITHIHQTYSTCAYVYMEVSM